MRGEELCHGKKLGMVNWIFLRGVGELGQLQTKYWREIACGCDDYIDVFGSAIAAGRHRVPLSLLRGRHSGIWMGVVGFGNWELGSQRACEFLNRE